ncbi:MAG TPA: NADH-quinone oxidoreductase subunit H [Gemmatimonadales bacterium]
MTGSAIAGYALLLAAAPLIPGVAVRAKSLAIGRRGPPALQLYYDLAKQWRRGTVYSATASGMVRLAPVASVVSAVLAAALVPVDGDRALLAFGGDVIAFAAVLAFGRFVMVLGALDTGSSLAGMGASRDITVAVFAEVALFTSLVGLAGTHGGDSLSIMLGGTGSPPDKVAVVVLIALALLAVLLAEAGRGPVDDPATHLELTMIHEVMILDHGGPDLALLLYGGAVRFSAIGALIVSLFVPAWPVVAALAVTIALLLGLAALVGIIEGTTARLRLARIPQFLVVATVLAALATVLSAH